MDGSLPSSLKHLPPEPHIQNTKRRDSGTALRSWPHAALAV